MSSSLSSSEILHSEYQMIMVSVKAISAALLSLSIAIASAQTCTPRPASQRLSNSGFEDTEDPSWGLRNAPIVSAPTYPSHTGSNAVLMTASYIKTAAASPAINNDSYIQQLTGATPRVTFSFKAYYNVLSLGPGPSCPSPTTLPLGTCKLEFTYAFQTIKAITLGTTSGYVEVSTPFLAETGGRSVQVSVSCKPAVETPSCAEVKVLLDDITFADPGWDCSWMPWGCWTDSTSFRSLPNHGILHNWPLTTTVESCADACFNQGFWYAGLEYGVECWCGNGLGGTPATDGCNMPCSGNPLQICGGPDRLNVYHKVGLPQKHV